MTVRQVIWARKRWGRGRLRQLGLQLCCGLVGGHAWAPCSENTRLCQRGCGAIEIGCGL